MDYVDSHAHFDLCLEQGGITEEGLLGGMADFKLRHAVHVAIDTDGYRWALDFSRSNRARGVLFAAGIHPSSRADVNDLMYLSDFVGEVADSSDAPLLFGIGETGLDYYRMRQPKETQLRSFEYQAELAKSRNLPLIVHSRDAMDDTLEVLTRMRPPLGVMHCFSGDSAAARRVLDLGFFISFAGNLTYKAAAVLHDAASYVPLDRLLFETDAPFLTPVPLRGRDNRPEYVVHTYDFFARLRGEAPSRLAERVYENFMSLVSGPGPRGN
jgi:TatD DNase family protein